MADCLNKILEKYKDLDRDVVTKIANDIEEARNNSANAAEFNQYAKIAYEHALIDSTQRKIAKYDSVIKKSEMMKFIAQKAFKGDPTAAIHAILVGADRAAMGGNMSIDLHQKTIEINHQQVLYSNLERKGLLDIWKQGELDRDISTELHKLQQKNVNEDQLKQGSALDIAREIANTQKSLLIELKMAGAPIRELDGRVARNSHDPQKIRGDLTQSEDQAFAKWSNDLMPLLDKEKTSLWNKNNPEAQQKFLRHVFDDILNDQGGSGPGTTGKRSIHFADGGGWYDYNAQYGKKSLFDTVKQEIKTTSRQAALINRLGVDYKDGWEQLNKSVEKSVSNDADAKKNFQDGKNFAQTRFETLLGVSDIPGNTWWAKAGDAVRGFVRMGIYGGSAFATPADIASSASMIRNHTGQSFLGSMADAIKGFADMLDPEQKAEVLHRIGLFHSDYLDSVTNKMSVADGGPGLITKAERVFYKATLLDPITDLADHAMARQAAFILGKHAESSWKGLDVRVRAGLERYGFNEANWEVTRGQIEQMGHGVNAITPRGIAEIPNEKIAAAIEAEGRLPTSVEIERYRRDLSYKVTGFIKDNLDIAVPKPGVREKSILLQGTKADTMNGQLARYFAEAKSFMLSMHKVVARTVTSDPNNPANKVSDIFKLKGDLSGLTGLALSSTAMAYLGWSAKEMVLGRTPPDPTKGQTWAEAFTRGGTGLIFADMLSGQYASPYRSLLGDLAGPTLGKANDLAEIWSKAVNGKTDNERKRAGKDLLNLIGRSVPGNNVPYVRAGLNYMFLYDLNEFMNRGSAAKLEQNYKDKGQSFFVSPKNWVH